MLNILYVMRNISGGGNSKRFWAIHELLAKKDLKITLLSTSNAGVGQTFDTTIYSTNIKIIPLKLPQSFISNYVFYIEAAKIARKIATEFDIIHDDFSPIAPLSFLWGNKTLATIHEVFGVNAIKRYGVPGLVPLINEKLYHKMGYRTFVVPSTSTSRELKKLGVDSTVIPNGVDTEIFKPKPDPKDSKNIVISMVSRFVPIKGHVFFLKIAKQLMRKHRNIKFLLPSTGPLLPEIRRLAKEFKLPIHFPGFLQNDEDIAKILQKSNIYVHTSLQEGFGISVCEAMACQLPIVAFDVPGVRDLVTPECGFLTSPKNVKEAADAVTKLILDDSLRHEFGLQARKRVIKNFTWHHSAQKLLEVYHNL